MSVRYCEIRCNASIPLNCDRPIYNPHTSSRNYCERDRPQNGRGMLHVCRSRRCNTVIRWETTPRAMAAANPAEGQFRRPEVGNKQNRSAFGYSCCHCRMNGKNRNWKASYEPLRQTGNLPVSRCRDYCLDGTPGEPCDRTD
jgi:hypothetical protein